jgi:hypothetical protein
MNCDTMLLCRLPTVECGPFDVNADKEYAISMFGKCQGNKELRSR